MKNYRICAVVILSAGIFFWSYDAMAWRGGGGHAGGGGGHFEGGGGRGGFEPGEHGGGEQRHWDPNNRPNPDHHWNPDNHDWNVNKNVTVNGNGDGWYGYGAADGALAGMAMGTMMGAAMSSNDSTTENNTTVVVQQPVNVLPVGTNVSMLPEGCEGRNVGGTQYYTSGGVWYKPYFGSNGVSYEVVNDPSNTQ